MMKKRSGFLSSVVIFGSLLSAASSAQAWEQWGTGVAPLDSTPAGQTYGRWAAQWAQWALGIPAAKNPLTDTTGAFCGQRQVDDVWFLAGTSGASPVVRSCNIPANEALFFPLINNVYGAFLSDPPEQRTEQYVRNAAACTQPAQISVSVDGKKVEKPERYFTGDSGSQSPLFNVQLPPGNIFGFKPSQVPELVFSPSAEQGYYLFLYPLPPGKHTIHWVATGCTSGASQDITYNLTVAK